MANRETIVNRLNNLPANTQINLQKLIPKKEWWMLWYFICTGKTLKNNIDKQ